MSPQAPQMPRKSAAMKMSAMASLPMRYKKSATASVLAKDCLKRASLRHITRRGGVQKHAANCYDALRSFVALSVREITKDANASRHYRKSKTIDGQSIRDAFKRMGVVLVGDPVGPHRKRLAALAARKSAALAAKKSIAALG